VDDINTITARLISKHTSPQIRNMMRLIDKHFDLWTLELFPVLQDQKLPCYKTVVGILHEAGHTVATESLVRSYFSVIRSRRGIPAKPYKAPVGVTPTVTLTRPAREVRADPGVRIPATDRPVAQAVSVPPVEGVPGVVPVEVTDWHGELRRLDTEGRSAVWTGADEWMWAYFKGCAKSMDKVLPKNIIDVENLLDDPIKVKVLHRILDKVET
jgi:hypothetical protein